MISQILTLARLESDSDIATQTTIELSMLLQETAMDSDFEARSMERSVIVVISEPLLVRGNICCEAQSKTF